MREYFLAHVGEVIDTHTLAAVAGIREYARRIRELRELEGYEILTQRDLDSLAPGEYLLRDPVPKARSARSISAALRAQILRRDGYTCQVCGRGAGDPDPLNPQRKLVLHIDHIRPVSEGGTSEPANLRVLCSACNEGRSNLEQPLHERTLYLLALIRRAPRDAQYAVYEALKRKFSPADE